MYKLSLGATRLSQPAETQPKRTGYPAAAGTMIIVSACLLAVSNVILTSSYPSDAFWIELPSLAVYIMLNILALLGGVQALVKKRLLFAVFGASILIPPSLSNTTFTLASLARTLIFAEDFTISIAAVLFIASSSVVLVLSVLSLIFLARSRREFS
jgi:hypothetical protein